MWNPTAASFKTLGMERQRGGGTVEGSDGSHNRRLGFSLLACVCPQRQPNSTDWEKNRQGKEGGGGELDEELMAPGFRAHFLPVCLRNWDQPEVRHPMNGVGYAVLENRNKTQNHNR